MESSGSGMEGKSSAARLELLGLPAESLSHIISYIPRKSLFSLLTVSRHFHHLASAALYRNLWFLLAQSEVPTYHKDPAYRLSDALHTFLTSTYDYAQHIRSFTFRMVDTDHDQIQKRIAAKFFGKEEAGKLLNTAILVMIKRAKSLEQFTWLVPIECSYPIYQALAATPSLQVLHIHLDISSVAKHSFGSFVPPLPSAPSFGVQPGSLWWDPVTSNLYPTGSGPVTAAGSKTSKANQFGAKAHSRNFGTMKGLQSLSITAIDDLSCLEEISACLKASSGTLKTLTLSLAESLVSKSQKPPPNTGHNPPPIQDDDATTDPGTPNMNAVGSGPSDLDLKREKQVQEQVLARIFSLSSVSSGERRQDKRVEKSLKRSAKSAFPTTFRSRWNTLVTTMMKAIQDSKYEEPLKSNMALLLTAFVTPSIKQSSGNAQEAYQKLLAAKKALSSYADAGPSMPPSIFGQTSTSSLDASGKGYSDSVGLGPQANSIPSADFDTYPGLSTNASASALNGWTQGSSSTPLPKDIKSGSLFGNDPLFSSSSAKSTAPPPSHWIPSQPSIFSSPAPPSIFSNPVQPLQSASSSHDMLFSTKGKKKPVPAPITPIESSSETSSLSESDSEGEPTVIPPAAVFGQGEILSADQDSDSDFDMDHPDVVESEDEEEANVDGDAEMDNDDVPPTSLLSQDTDNVDTSSDKGKQKTNGESQSNSAPRAALSSKITTSKDGTANEVPVKTQQTVEESIQEYVRTTHGLSIQELVLCFIPLKASVLARALDLTVLQRLVLYNVGPQGAFWSMVGQLTEQGVIFSLQALFTDDVSAAFVACLACLPGLKSLHLLRRSSKELSSTSKQVPASLDTIHRVGLVSHFETLQSLSLTNLEDDTWDGDDRLVRALASKAKKLRELAISLDSNSFHTFLRCLPGLRNLVAFHLIHIKASGNPGLIPNNEWKKLVLDVVCYYPSLKLKYLAINLVSTFKVSQIGEKPKSSVAAWFKKAEEQQAALSSSQSAAKGKAKGKARATDTSSPSQAWSMVKNGSTAIGDNDRDSDSDLDGRPNVVFSKQLRPSTLADSYVIFSNFVLKGRL